MAKERVREPMSALPTPEHLRARADEGWRLVAVEWERTVGSDGNGQLRQEVPYGLRVSNDCFHLEEDPEEQEALRRMLELIVDDEPLSKVAEQLEEAGLKTRAGGRWTQTAVFELLPRLIDAAPEIFASASWKRDRGAISFPLPLSRYDRS